MNKKCKNCYGKGYATMMRGDSIAYPDFMGGPVVLSPQKIIKVPCMKCNTWRILKTEEYFKSS
jgi:hypothetical protein